MILSLTASLRVATSFQRIEAMRYTPYMDDNLRILSEANEYASDVTLVHLVKVQHIVERVGQVIYSQQWDNSSLKSLIWLQIASYQAELDTLRDSLPEDLKDDGIGSLSLHLL